MAIYKYVIM